VRCVPSYLESVMAGARTARVGSSGVGGRALHAAHSAGDFAPLRLGNHAAFTVDGAYDRCGRNLQFGEPSPVHACRSSRAVQLPGLRVGRGPAAFACGGSRRAVTSRARAGRGYPSSCVLTRSCLLRTRFGPRGAGLVPPRDLARWRADGVLDFLGRRGSQVKLRGFRIEQIKKKWGESRLRCCAMGGFLQRRDCA